MTKMKYPLNNEHCKDKATVAPNPPTPESVRLAQFIDKTYIWKHK